MKQISIILCGLLFLCCAQKNTRNEFLDFELRPAQCEPAAGFNPMALFNSDRTIFVGDSVFVSIEDLISAEVVDKKAQPKVKVLLNEKGRRKFAEFTLQYTGKRAAIIVGGTLVSAPKINARTTKGVLLIAGYFDLKEAEKIAAGLQIKHPGD